MAYFECRMLANRWDKNYNIDGDISGKRLLDEEDVTPVKNKDTNIIDTAMEDSQ